MSRLVAAACFLAFAFLVVPQGPIALAQKKGPEVIVPAPQAPSLTGPAGVSAKLGASTDVSLTGQNLSDPTGTIVGAPLKASISQKNKNEPTRIVVAVEVPKDAPIGVYPIRVATKTGASNQRALVVDDLPEVRESNENSSKDTAQSVTPPCVVAGRVDAESADFFKLPVKAGQRLTIEVVGRRMGSQIDPLIVLHDAKTKRELISLYADDSPGLQGDARLTHTFKEPGEILVEVRDTTYRGGANFPYRLRIGEFPGATTAFPLAVQRGQTTSIGFSGPGADLIPPVKVMAPADTNILAIRVSPKFAKGPSGWPVQVRLSDNPEGVEKEPNNEAAKATPIAVPGGVSARFATANDIDYFQFPANKGQKLALAVLAYEINAPTEVLLRVVDEKGKELAKSNPAQPSVKAEFTAPADGNYFAVCEHLNFLSGPNEVYHLSVRPALPDFEFTLPVDNVEAPIGGGTAIAVTNINRLNGFTEPIEFRIVGDPVLGGSITVPADATTAYVPVTVKPGTKPGAYAFRVQGKSRDIVRYGTNADLAKAAFANLPNPPLDFVGQAAAGATDDAPFTLAISADPASIEKGKTGKLVIEAKRKGYDGDITIAAVAPPANAAIAAKPLPKGAAKVDATVTANAAGPAAITLKATAKIGGKDYVVLTEPVIVTVTEAKKGEPKKDAPKKDVPKEKAKK